MRVASESGFRFPRLGRAPEIIAFLLVLALLGAMAIQPTRQLLAQRDRISGVAEELHRVQETNARLEAQIQRLNNPDYIEQRARAQIGLVRPGETTYVVMPPSKRASPLKARPKRPEPPPPPNFLRSVLHFIGIG